MSGQETDFTGRSADMRKDAEFLGAEDLLGIAPFGVEVERVVFMVGATMSNGEKKDVYCLVLKGAKKRLVLNATNRKALAFSKRGGQAPGWIGAKITLDLYDTRQPKTGQLCKGIYISAVDGVPTTVELKTAKPKRDT